MGAADNDDCRERKRREWGTLRKSWRRRRRRSRIKNKRRTTPPLYTVTRLSELDTRRVVLDTSFVALAIW